MINPSKNDLLAKVNRFKETFIGQSKDVHCRGFLPHFDIECHYQMITYRLNDSLPKNILEELREKDAADVEYRKKIEDLLDAGMGSCILKIPEIAEMIIENWNYFDKKKYDLIAFVVMSNHVHILIKSYKEISLSEVIHSWKSYTSKKFKGILEAVNYNSNDIEGNDIRWRRDYWDRYIRDEQHFISAVNYIHNNPVKAGMCSSPEEWPFSSSYKIN